MANNTNELHTLKNTHNHMDTQMCKHAHTQKQTLIRVQRVDAAGEKMQQQLHHTRRHLQQPRVRAVVVAQWRQLRHCQLCRQQARTAQATIGQVVCAYKYKCKCKCEC